MINLGFVVIMESDFLLSLKSAVYVVLYSFTHSSKYFTLTCMSETCGCDAEK